MEELFVKTQNGNIPIVQEQIEKYHLKIGDISPNNGYCIVNKSGENKKEAKSEKPSTDYTLKDMNSEGMIFTTSEILDIAQGADS